MNQEHKLYWVLFTENTQAPVIRKHVKAHSLMDVKIFIRNNFPESTILRMGELTDIEPGVNMDKVVS